MPRLTMIRRIDLEAVFWITGLLGLAIARPDVDDHYTLCVFKRMGFKRCPGCGLGRSISYLVRGHVRDSLKAHPLAIFATIVIMRRIVFLLRRSLPEQIS